MLSLRRKPGERVFIGDEPLEVTNVTSNAITVFYKGYYHDIVRGYMYTVERDVIICYNKKMASSAKFQILSPVPILREELRGKRPNVES